MAASAAICMVSTRNPSSSEGGTSRPLRRNQCAQSAVTVTWMSGTRERRPASTGSPSCSLKRGLHTGTSVSVASRIQFDAGFFNGAKRIATSKSSRVRSTNRWEVSILTRMSGNCRAKRSSRGSRIRCAKVGAALTDRVPVALRPGSCSVAVASTVSA